MVKITQLEKPLRLIKFNLQMAKIITAYNSADVKDIGITRADRKRIINKLQKVISDLED